MNILAINTVGSACEAALIGPEMEYIVREEMVRGHDARIAIVVEQAIREAGAQWPDVDRIGVVTGPGSFTGIRVGVSFARGLSLALKVPVAGVTALEALGAGTDATTLAILPAQRRPPDRTWWAQVLQVGRGVDAPLEIDEDRVVELAGSVGHVVGLSAPESLLARCEPLAPSALAAARLCSRIDVETAPARPIYVRAPDAAPMRPMAGEKRG